MGSSFAERCDVLSEMVGHGDLTGSVVVDQLYAAIQLPCTITSNTDILEVGRRSTCKHRSWSITTNTSPR